MVLIVGDSTLNSAPSSLEEFFETSLEVWFNFNIISYHRQHNHQLTHPRQHCIGEGVQSSNILLCEKTHISALVSSRTFFSHPVIVQPKYKVKLRFQGLNWNLRTPYFLPFIIFTNCYRIGDPPTSWFRGWKLMLDLTHSLRKVLATKFEYWCFQICEANKRFTSQASTSVKRKDYLEVKCIWTCIDYLC